MYSDLLDGWTADRTFCSLLNRGPRPERGPRTAVRCRAGRGRWTAGDLVSDHATKHVNTWFANRVMCITPITNDLQIGWRASIHLQTICKSRNATRPICKNTHKTSTHTRCFCIFETANSAQLQIVCKWIEARHPMCKSFAHGLLHVIPFANR